MPNAGKFQDVQMPSLLRSRPLSFVALFAQLGGGTWQLDPADSRELSGLSAPIVALAQQFAPDRCQSAPACFELTRDVRDTVALMVAQLRRPDLLDAERVRLWTAA